MKKTLLERLSKYRQKNSGRYRPGWAEYDYGKALGEARIEEIKRIVSNEKRNHAHARIEKNNGKKQRKL